MPAPDIKIKVPNVKSNINICIWKNEKSDSVSIDKSYRDKNGNWSKTNFFFKEEIYEIGKCIMENEKEFSAVSSLIPKLEGENW